MRIERVILASDGNPMYLDFWPLVATAWRRLLGVRPTLALVASSDVRVDERVGDVVRFEPLADVPSGFQAQVIRLLLPALYGAECSLLSDIDMLPLSRRYFRRALHRVADDAFVVFRDAAYAAGLAQYPICYVAARGATFGEIFGITGLADIAPVMREWATLDWGWSTDERILYQRVNQWPACAPRCAFLGHRVARRIDRAWWRYRKPLVPLGRYTDAHLLRPYSEHRREIDSLARWALLR